MLILYRFNDAYRSWQQGRCLYRLVQDQATVLIRLCRNSYRPIADGLEVTDADIQWLLQQPEAADAYADLLGGNFHVCQSASDLLKIEGCDFDFADQHGRWPNATDLPLAWDLCDYLPEQFGQPQWVVFLSIWNEAGGPVYYVPKHLWQAARVEEHMAMTNQFWQGGQ